MFVDSFNCSLANYFVGTIVLIEWIREGGGGGGGIKDNQLDTICVLYFSKLQIEMCFKEIPC